MIYLTAIVLLLLRVNSLEFSECIPSNPPYNSFTASVIYQPNNEKSINGKNWLKAKFCEKFNISCEINSNGTGLYLKHDLQINIPSDDFTETVMWLQQNRLGILGSGYNLDLVIQPNSGCPEIDFKNYSIQLGHKYPFNPNNLIYKNTSEQNFCNKQQKSDIIWAYNCSFDCLTPGYEVCLPPYANNIQCADNAKGWHLHLYFINNYNQSVEAKDQFHDLMAAAMNIPATVMDDNYGHEQPHNRTGWLAGPGGHETNYPQNHSFSSFVIGTTSLYVVKEDFAKATGFIMKYRSTVQVELDFLYHPTFGCNFADHQEWALHGGAQWRNNLYGISNAGDYANMSICTSLDPHCDSFYPLENKNCSLGPFEKYNLHIIYDPSNESQQKSKFLFLGYLKETFPQLKYTDDPYAYLQKNSQFLAGQVQIEFQIENFDKIVPFVMQYRTQKYLIYSDLDLVIAPITNCQFEDYVKNSLWGGNSWPYNIEALKEIENNEDNSKKSQQISNVENPVNYTAYILYMQNAPNNEWANQAKEYFAGNLTNEFQLENANCTNQYPNPEPTYEKLCIMGLRKAPYMNSEDPMTVSNFGVYIPQANFTQVVNWAIEWKSSRKVGYDLDLLLVGLSKNSYEDYVQTSLKAGSYWRLNKDALK